VNVRRRVRVFIAKLPRRIAAPLLLGLLLFLLSDAIVDHLARVSLLGGVSRTGTLALFAVFALLNIAVLIFALKPSRGLLFHSETLFRNRISKDIDEEQEQMPEVLRVLGHAARRPEERRALRHLALFYVPLLLLPLWWSVFVERRVAAVAHAACARTVLTAQAMMSWIFGNDVSGCDTLGATLGKIAGGVVLFMGAVFFRSRLQIALRGFARFHRRG